MQTAQHTIQQVPLIAVVAGLNDRRRFNGLEELADNIRRNDLICPPTYRRMADGRYQVIAGERRTRACRDILGWETIPARVIDADDRAAVAMMGAENRCRVQLHPVEEAQGYATFMAQFGADEAETAGAFGVNAQLVKDRLALLTLCEDVQGIIGPNGFSVGYALILAKAGLDRNFQGRALDLFNSNPAPTPAWFRGICSDLVSKQAQASLFDWGAYATEAKAAVQARLPHPRRDMAPIVGTGPLEVFRNQAAYWEGIAAQYMARGKKRDAEDCQLAARTILGVFWDADGKPRES